MIPELGLYALILGFCTALLLGIVPLIGSFNGRSGWMAMARPAAMMQLFFVALSYACLTWTFIANDFSVLYTANTSNSGLPLVYKISGVWGGHEGSILLWVLILSVWVGAVAIFSANLPAVLLARVLSVLGLISVGFMMFVLLTSNPFERMFPIPADGASLNPLLQDPGMAIHPPMLYMGYVGFAVAFAFAVAALIEGKLDSATLRWMRPWTNIAWVFLTIGISLGSYWAYYELGWGGWWFWDPVENASFMPWLIGTALIHSLAASEKRGVFKAWTVLLAVLAFSLSLLGTFLVRSGILTSVHAFATDPARGQFVLLFLLIVIGGSLLLFAFRAGRLKGTSDYELVSREGALLLNNVLLVVACATVLLGTMYPLFLDVTAEIKLSIGVPWFNLTFVPLMLPIVFIVGVGSMLNWKRDKLEGRRNTFIVLLVASMITAALLGTQLYEFKITAVAAIALSVWVVATCIYGLVYRLRNKKNRLHAVMHTPAAFWGMTIAHIGVGVFTIGVALTSIYTQEDTVRMGPGVTHEIGPYTVGLASVEEVRGPNYLAMQGEFLISRDGKSVSTVQAQKRIYDVRRDLMTEAGIDAGLTRDIFIAMGESIDDNGAWAVRVQLKPFIRWIWVGTLIMALGGLMAALDGRYRMKKRKRESVAAKSSSSTTSAAVS